MKMLINGMHADASNGETINVTNPATGEFLYTIPRATTEDIDKAIEAAQYGKNDWGEMPLHERIVIMNRFADLLDQEKDTIRDSMLLDTGKSFGDCTGEFSRLRPLINGYTGKAAHLYGDHFPDNQAGMEHDIIMTERVPLGVVVCIIPFNVPISMFCQKVVPALIMGNSVIIKPPTENPSSTIMTSELLLKAGVPSTAVQVITGKGSEIGNYLCSSPKINAATLTGSDSTGMQIMACCAKNLNPCTFELGGNDATIIFEDCDLEKTAKICIESRKTVTGQACGSMKRIIIQNSIKDKFAEILAAEAKKLKVGDPADHSVEMGCLISEAAAKTVESQVNETVDAGAAILAGGKRRGAFYDMTVLGNVTEDMDIAQNMEIFGPVLPIIGFDTAEDAIRINNNTVYGLNASIIGDDLRRNVKVAQKLHVGHVVFDYHNNYRPAEIPWGGPGHSGIGREGVCASLQEYSELKTFTFKDIR